MRASCCRRPRCIRVTAAAQAPLPQARVSPTPRSNTRRRACAGPITWAKPTFTERGNDACCCSSEPTRSTGAASIRPTSITACGLPIDTAANRTLSPCSGSRYSSRAWAKPINGTLVGSNAGTPMVTANWPSPSTFTSWLASGLSMTNASPCALPSRTSHAAMQRAPLPHCSELEPSAFQIRYEATEPSARGASMVRI
ncbi:hypothetical protein G6F22_017719 [Rhizopus arrhizus]|nr:hypothetical protein G6F22_017719 [Rhizopus arrhizus]